jgi:hypothetical protein
MRSIASLMHRQQEEQSSIPREKLPSLENARALSGDRSREATGFAAMATAAAATRA